MAGGAVAVRGEEGSGLLRAGARPSAKYAKRQRYERELRSAFFRIGCGSSITFNAVVMGVAYLRTLFGAGVLRELSLAHNVALLSSLLSLMSVGSWDRSPFDSPRACARLLQGALAFAALFNGAMLVAILVVDATRESAGGTPGLLKWSLVACIAVNGAATAVVQGVGATFGGHLERDRGGGCGGGDAPPGGSVTSAAQLTGAGLGVLAPTLTQLLCVSPAAFCADPAACARAATRLGAALGACLGLASCLGAGYEARRLASRHFARAKDAPKDDAHPSSAASSTASPSSSFGALDESSLRSAALNRSRSWSEERRPSALFHVRGSVDLETLRRASAKSEAPLPWFILAQRRRDLETDAAAQAPAVQHRETSPRFSPLDAAALRRVLPLAAAQVTNEAALVYLLLQSPKLAPAAERPLVFWATFLATILLVVSNLGAFLGRWVASKAPEHRSAPCKRALLALVFVSPCYGAVARAAFASAPPRTNAEPIALFFAAASLSGFTLVALSQWAHAEVTDPDLAPLVSQIAWLSVNIGSILGTALAFAL